MKLLVAPAKRCVLFVGGLAILVALAGCSTLPRPKSLDNSLLVLVVAPPTDSASSPVSDEVVIDGPTSVKTRLTGGSDGVYFFRVAPGRYRVVSRTIRWRGGATRTVTNLPKAELSVESSTIVLPNWKFAAADRQAGANNYGVVPTSPADRRRAAAALRNYVQVAEWAGRRVSGFAPYSPFSDYVSTNYSVEIESNPPGAKILIDGQAWGDTPLSVILAPGKHFVRLERKGYEPHTSFINVGGKGTESFTLKPAPESTAANGASGRIPVLIEPFANLSGSRYDNLAGVLTNSLSVALRHAGVDVVGGDAAARNPRAPDFAAAEKAGAQAFVAGDYSANEQSILIHAALYDTRTRLVKTSVLFDGEGGVSIFDSIDKVSAQLSSAVEKALPEVGQSVVQERVITPQEVTFNTRVHEQDVIRRRNEKKYSIAVGPNLAGVFDQVVDPADPTNRHDRTNGPGVGIKAGMDLPLAGQLSLHVETMPILYPDAANKLKVEVPVYVGPRMNFYGYMSDVFLGLQAAAHFAPQSAVSFSSTGQTVTTTVGPFWLLGLNFETGVKIYTYRKLSDLPTYLGVGLRLGIFGYRFNLDFSNAVSYPMEVALGVYWGTRL